ncbi:MAG TPA: hypothetical protein VHL80_03030 [Polyangia bacterium]|nr:hypothetical protein [Polyangia bacterium]
MRARLAASVATLFLVVGCGGGSGGGPGAAGSSGAGTNGGAGSGAAGSAGSAGASATGTGGHVAPPAGVDGTKTLTDASDADKTATCDWFATLAGGYGTTSACGSAVLNAPEDQARCLETFPACDVTFSDFEACVVAVVHAQTACTDSSVQDAESSADCASVVPAGCF